MLAHRDHHIEVAGRPTVDARLTLTGQTDTVAVIHPRRHLDRQGLGLLDPALTMTVLARIGNHLPSAMTARTGLLHGKEALLHAYLTMPTTGGTGARLGAFLGTAAIAGIATDQGRHLDGDGGAAYRLFQIQLHGVAQITATLRRGATTTAATTEDIAEYVAEDIGEVATTPETAGAAHVRIHAGMTVLVVGRPLVGIGQNLVGLVGFLEFLFRLLVIRVAVRVILHCQPAIGFLQLGFTGAALHAQHFIIVTLGHKSCFLWLILRHKQQRGNSSRVALPHCAQARRSAGLEHPRTTCCP